MSDPCTIFLDANILQYAFMERLETKKHTIKWGNRATTLDLATTPVPYHPQREEWLQYEVDSLPKIAELVRLGRFELYISTEIDLEADFEFAACSELSVFHGIPFRKLLAPFKYGRIIASSSNTQEEIRERRDSLFGTADLDPRFDEIKRVVGGSKDLDAFHILSAERGGMDYLITADGKLIKSLRQRRRLRFQLAVKVVYPSELLHEVYGWRLNPWLDPITGGSYKRSPDPP
jgi:hypothetical protein